MFFESKLQKVHEQVPSSHTLYTVQSYTPRTQLALLQNKQNTGMFRSHAEFTICISPDFATAFICVLIDVLYTHAPNTSIYIPCIRRNSSKSIPPIYSTQFGAWSHTSLNRTHSICFRTFEGSDCGSALGEFYSFYASLYSTVTHTLPDIAWWAPIFVIARQVPIEVSQGTKQSALTLFSKLSSALIVFLSLSLCPGTYSLAGVKDDEALRLESIKRAYKLQSIRPRFVSSGYIPSKTLVSFQEHCKVPLVCQSTDAILAF